VRAIIFDTGPIISLATNNLLWILEELKKKYDGEFYITDPVKKEIIDKPFEGRRFKFEAMQVFRLISNGTLKIIELNDIKKKTDLICDTANRIFKAHNHEMRIMHYAEASTLAAAMQYSADAVVIDERTTRLLIESPKKVGERLEFKLHTKIDTDQNALDQIAKEIDELKVIRSVELVIIAYEYGFLDKFIFNMPDARKTLLEALLWGVKLNGASLTEREIDAIIKFEKEK